jgi:hypothetical protein
MSIDRQREVFLRNLFGGIRDAEGKVTTARLRVPEMFSLAVSNQAWTIFEALSAAQSPASLPMSSSMRLS